MSSRHREVRFNLIFGEYSNFSNDEEEVDALEAFATALTAALEGELGKLVVPRLVDRTSTDLVTRCSGNAAARGGGDFGVGLVEEIPFVRLFGAVTERLGIPRKSSVFAVLLSDTTPPAFKGGLVLIPCATLDRLSVTLFGEKLSFMGGGGP